MERHLEYLRANPGHTPEQRADNRRAIKYYEAIAKREAAKQKVEQEAAEKAAQLATPKCQDAITHAKAVLRDVKFDPSVQQAEVEQAEKRLAIAETGDPQGYWWAVKPWIDARDARLCAAVNSLKQQAATLADRATQIAASGQIPADVAAEMAAAEKAKEHPKPAIDTGDVFAPAEPQQ